MSTHDASVDHPYRGATIALLTRHGKERVVRPAFATAFDARVRLVDDFDTDVFGSFTQEVPRVGTQLDAARAKARMGMQLTDCPLGLASEGSFGPGPLGVCSANLELVLWIDAELGIEVVGRAHAVSIHARERVETLLDLERAASRAGFPDHGVVLRAEHDEQTRLRKGLTNREALVSAFRELTTDARGATIHVENDLRAHLHPTRMANIAAATADLVRRLLERCPDCRVPGYGSKARVPGLRCRDCGSPTGEARAEVIACVRCAREEERPFGPSHADPAQCDHCNP